MIPVAAVATGLMKYGPAVYAAFKSMFGHRQTIDYNELQNWLGQLHAEGSLSPQDYAAADLTQSRLADAATSTGKMLTTDALARARQRGIDQAPATEATLMRIAQSTARGRMQAGDTAAAQLYSAYGENRQFDAAKKLALINAKIGGAAGNVYGANAERAGLLNSLLESIPGLIPNSGGVPVSPQASPPTAPLPDPTPSPVPNMPPTSSSTGAAYPLSAAQRVAGVAGRSRRMGRPYRFNAATGGLGYGSQQPTFGGGGMPSQGYGYADQGMVF